MIGLLSSADDPALVDNDSSSNLLSRELHWCADGAGNFSRGIYVMDKDDTGGDRRLRVRLLRSVP